MPSHTGKQAARRGGRRGASGPERFGGVGGERRCLASSSRWRAVALGALLAVSRPAHAVGAPAEPDPIENTDGALAPGPGLFEASRLEPGTVDGADGGYGAARGGGAGARRRGLWLGVSGGMAVSPGERERVFGLFELGLSLDEWFGAGPAVGDAFDGDGDGDGDGDAADVLGSGMGADMATAEDGAGTPETAGTAGTAARAAGAPSLSPFAPGTGLATPALARPTFTAGFATPALAAAPTSGPLPREPLPRAPTIWPADEAPSNSAGPSWARPASAARSLDPAAAALARAAVSEALRIQGSGTELRRLDSMASRSRAAASLPEVRLGAGTSRDESMRLSPTVSDPAHFSRDGGRDLWLEARLTWRLDGAIFARDEIAIMRLRAQQRDGAAQRSREVLEALLDWQRARLVLASPLASPEEVDAATVRHFGAVARLDVYTDGWFSRQLARWGTATP